jgi:hypothetical protein
MLLEIIIFQSIQKNPYIKELHRTYLWSDQDNLASEKELSQASHNFIQIALPRFCSVIYQLL